MVTALKLTIDRLEALPDDDNRYELIDGELLVSKAPGTTHQRSLGRLFNRLTNYLVDNPIGELIFGPGVVFDDYNAVIPDIVYVSSERQHIVTERGLIDAPDLAIEVVSPGEKNSERDRQLKRHLYSRRGVREYCVVDPQLRTIEVYRLQENVLVLEATLRGSDVLTSALLPGFSCAVSEMFA
jgi:Uma2 family endonuclease